MDEGIKIGMILLVFAVIAIGGGYYFVTKHLPKD